MHQYKQQLLLDSAALEIGETSRAIICPWCRGRNDVENNSFIITRVAEGILFKCWRAKCNKQGFIPMSGRIPANTSNKKKSSKIFNRPLTRLPAGIRRWLIQKYNFTLNDIENNHLRYDFTVNYLAMPMYTSLGREYGVAIKRLPEQFLSDSTDIGYWNNSPKVIMYPMDPYEPALHFPQGFVYNRPVVIVEDILSAIRIGQFISSVALLGTSLSDYKVQTLLKCTRHVILALDPDTWQGRREPLPVALQKKYELFFDKFEVRKLTADPKDLSSDEIKQQILGE